MSYWTKEVSTPEDRVALIERMVASSIEGEKGVELRAFVIRNMLPGSRDRDDMSQVNAVYHWVRKNIRYIEDPILLDFYGSALTTLEAGGGDCDCHTILVCSSLIMIGFLTGARVVQSSSGDWHIYAVAFLPKISPSSPIALDTAWEGVNQPGKEYPPMSCRYRQTWAFDFGGVK